MEPSAIMVSETLTGERPAAAPGPFDPPEWRREPGLLAYPAAIAGMEARVAAILAETARELVWLVEHPPLYTAGSGANPRDLIDPARLPVFPTGRGGQYTYHGPGQRVAYVMLDLNRRGRDLRRFVGNLEAWLIRTLAVFGVTGERRDGRVGVWVRRPDKGGGIEEKIAAIGVRVRRWVTFHGIALNVAPNLDDFSGIVPCGLDGYGVTSLADLGVSASMADVDAALAQTFDQAFPNGLRDVVAVDTDSIARSYGATRTSQAATPHAG